MPRYTNDEPILRALSEFSPQSIAQLADNLGWKIKRVEWYIRRMYAAKLLYVAVYPRVYTHGMPTPHYAIGNCKDARRPPKSDEKERSAMNYQKMKSDPALYERRLRMQFESMKKRIAKNPELAERVKRQQREYSRRKRGTTHIHFMAECPIPRPAFYKNIFEDARK